MDTVINNSKAIKRTITIPGDKSISHRSVMLGSLANGTTHVHGFLTGEDCLSTIACFKKMGIEIELDGTDVTVHGKGLNGLKAPTETLDVGNSGTTLRLMTGILSAQPFSCTVTGDSSIQKRPMDRVEKPLKQMGAEITGQGGEKILAPLHITGHSLKGTHYTLPVASAQVKSAIILAGLYAEGKTVITEPEATRDHTEIMLNHFGADIKRNGNDITVTPVKELYAKEIFVPGDISSAAYFMVLGAVCPDSDITIKNVGINPTRTGIITVLENMGANITLLNERTVSGEKVADINVKYTPSLKSTTVEGDIIPKLIDEIPVIAVAACFAEGTTVIKDAQELKVKESNRIKTVVNELKKFGADIEETDDGMIIKGKCSLKGAVCDSHNDHRIAMSMAVAGIMAEGSTTIKDSQCVDISFPTFFSLLK